MARSREYLRQTNVMDPALNQAIAQRPFFARPNDFFEEREARAAHLRKLRYLLPVPGPIPDLVSEKELKVPARDGYQIRVIHYAPTQPPIKPLPLVVLYHEGGFCMGDLSDEEFNARLLVRDLQVVCLNVEYRLAPEHTFPTWMNDSWDALVWAVKNAASLGADPAQGLVVGGSSAGGNISAMLAHLSRTEKLNPPVTGQWLSVPYLIPSTQIPEKYKDEFISPKENVDDPVLHGGLNDTAEAGMIQITKYDITSPLLSVVAKGIYPPDSKTEEAGGKLAKAFFQVAGMDPLRDHALVYDRILREEYGTQTRVDLYPGYGHMFWTNWPEMPASAKFASDMLEGFRWLLS